MWLERRALSGLEELGDLDLGALDAGERPGFGTCVEEPLFAVCTNGRVDACCALLGRPIVEALQAEAAGQVWECTHLGGDRFAPNLLALPHGVLFGRLTAMTAVQAVRALREGRIDLRHYRGRMALDAAAQAAEDAVRREFGLTALDAVQVESVQPVEPAVSDVTVRFGDAVAGLRLREHRHAVARPLTCGGADDRVRSWEVTPLSTSAAR
jgi:hypothetical protein